MNLLKALLFIALSLQPWYKDKDTETHQDRVDRYAVISQGVTETIDDATCTGSQKHNPYCERVWIKDPDTLAFVLLTLAYQESKFAKNVHAGNCEKHQCDAYKDKDGKIRHRATSLWQIQPSVLVPPNEWETLAGLDQVSTTHAADASLRIFLAGYRQCKTVTGGISRYAGVSRCDWPHAQFRASFAERLHRKAKHYEANNWVRAPNKITSKVEIAKVQLGPEYCTVIKQGRGLAFMCAKGKGPQGTKENIRVAMED
jgi:hypothetical protein